MSVGSLYRSRLSDITFVLVCASPAVPVLAWVVAQFLTVRIAHPWEWTGAYIETLSVDIFAFIFLLSTITNLLVVLGRRRDKPLAYTRPLRLPLWTGILYVLSVAWIVSLGVGVVLLDLIEPLICLAIAAASVVVCVWALKKDPESSAKSATRLHAKVAWKADPANARIVKRQNRVRRVAIFVALGALVAWVAVGELTVHHFTNCTINEEYFSSGEITLSSDRCGKFWTMGNEATSNKILDRSSTYDFITQGYRLGFPPAAIIISMTPSEPHGG